jgi:hypothetical protein
MNLKNPFGQIEPDRRYFVHGWHLPVRAVIATTVDPLAYLTSALTAIVNGHKQS